MKAGLLPRTVGSAAAAFTATGFGRVFFGVKPGAGVPAGSVDEVTAVLSGGFI
jgi:hypothetical protein